MLRSRSTPATARLLAATALLPLTIAAPALAQVPAADAAAVSSVTAVEEIVVTAQRRAQNLQDVPISITAFSAQALDDLAADDIGEALEFAPNVAITAGPSGGDDGGFFIRGVGQLDNSIAVDPGVGVYIDEIYIGRLQASSLDLVDVERIEVLRGPQGTLFGRNTIGGAVSVITADPTDDLTFRGRVIGGSRNRIDVAASIAGPIMDGLGFRLTGFTRNQDGFSRNAYTGDRFGTIRDLGGRVKLVLEPIREFRMEITGDYIRGRGSQSGQVLLGFNRATGITVPRPPFLGGPFFQPGVSPQGVPFPAPGPTSIESDRSPDYRVNFMSVPAQNDSENGGVSVNITGQVGDLRIRSITGYRKYDELLFNDFDTTGFVLYDSRNQIRQEQVSQEFQLAGDALDGRFNYLLGAYYFGEHATNQIDLCTGSNRPRPATFPPAPLSLCLVSRNTVGLDVDSYAGFSQLSFDVTEALNIFGGIRYTRETKRQTNLSISDNRAGVPTLIGFNPVTGAGSPAVAGPGQVRTALPFTQVERTFTAWTPKVGFDFKLAQRVSIYGSYAEGFKSGGFNGRPSSQQILSYEPETVETFEVGLKSELFDRALRLNAAVFTSKYNQIQLLVGPNAVGLFETANAGDATIRGAEVEADARVGENLELRGAVGYLDAYYRRLAPNIATGVTLSDRLPVTPEWTWSASAQYRLPLGESVGDLFVRADYNYRSTVSYQIENDPLEIQPGFGLLNLRATYVLPNENIRLAVFGTNVTDKRYFQNMQDSRAGNGVAFGGYGRPREWGVELNVRF